MLLYGMVQPYGIRTVAGGSFLRRDLTVAPLTRPESTTLVSPLGRIAIFVTTTRTINLCLRVSDAKLPWPIEQAKC